MSPLIEFYYGTVGCGKSSALLQQHYNYKSMGLRPLLLTSSLDTRNTVRDAQGRCRVLVSSRVGLSAEAVAIKPWMDLYAVSDGYDCVLLDEAQFLSEGQAVALIHGCVQRKVPLKAYGLRSTFFGMPFAASAVFMAHADLMQEIASTLCRCGARATMNMRVNPAGALSDGSLPVITLGDPVAPGDLDTYWPTCAPCYWRATEAGVVGKIPV